MRRPPLILATAVLLAAGCGPQAGQQAGSPADSASAANPGAIADSIRSLDQQWSDAAGRHDAQAFAAFYASDGMIMPPNMEAASGSDAIQKLMGGMLADTSMTLSFQPADVNVAKAGDMAWEHGTWAFKGGSGQQLDHGKYVVVWKRGADGSWKAAADIFNSNVQARAAKK